MRLLPALALFFYCAGAAAQAPPQVRPPGSEKSAKLKALSAGAQALQTQSPPAQLDAYIVGLHPMKADPSHQVEAHHFCRQVNEDFAQCALFDGNTADANLVGIEYIITAKLFEGLPAAEKQYWHPHNYEILSGQLVAPGLPDAVEKEFLETKLNSFGKTWHVWNTGHFGMNDADRLPLGDPELAWSFNRDGEALPGLIGQMEKRLDVDVSKKRESREELRSRAGVSAPPPRAGPGAPRAGGRRRRRFRRCCAVTPASRAAK